METGLYLRLSDGQVEKRIVDGLGADFDFCVERPVAEDRTYFDTFDWLLFGKSLILYQSGGEYILRSLKGGERLVRVETSSTATFAWELPDGSLRDRVHTVIKARALLPLASVQIKTTVYRVLNEDEKTVARIILTEQRSCSNQADSGLAAYVSLHPVRGYSKSAKRLTKSLDLNKQAVSVEADVYLGALRAAGQTSGSYSTKLDLHLERDMRSDVATKMIMHRLLETMRVNEAGIRADIDIEYLHDYRVAIRKTRSALSQIRGVFPSDVTERFKQEFRVLGQRTNALRDLDVYLLAEPEYRAMLPVALQNDIAPLFDYLRSQRGQALAEVVEGLDSQETNEALAEWEAFLDEPSPEKADAVNAAVPVHDLSGQRIYRRYRRIVKSGKSLVKHAEDEKLHALRIDCKKLRYLLEFFASLYPSKKMERLIREQKRLQDNLGDFNDLSVQQVYLMGIAEALPMDDPRTGKALFATGALVEALARKQELIKGEFAEKFSAFASAANRKTYRKLFADRRAS